MAGEPKKRRPPAVEAAKQHPSYLHLLEKREGKGRKAPPGDLAGRAPVPLDPPPWLPKGAKAHFVRIRDGLDAAVGSIATLPSVLDLLALAALRVDEVERLTRTIERQGSTYCYSTKSGAAVRQPVPEVGMRNEASRQLKQVLSEIRFALRDRGPGPSKKNSFSDDDDV